MFRIIGILLAVVVTVIVLAIVGYGWWINPGYDPLRFTTQEWTNASHETRGHMVEDLLETHTLPGMYQEEVLALLGDPDSAATVAEMYERSHPQDKDDEWLVECYGESAEGRLHHAFYHLGHMGFREGAPFVFPYTLHVLFRDGRATHAYVDD